MDIGIYNLFCHIFLNIYDIYRGLVAYIPNGSKNGELSRYVDEYMSNNGQPCQITLEKDSYGIVRFVDISSSNYNLYHLKFRFDSCYEDGNYIGDGGKAVIQYIYVPLEYQDTFYKIFYPFNIMIFDNAYSDHPGMWCFYQGVYTRDTTSLTINLLFDLAYGFCQTHASCWGLSYIYQCEGFLCDGCDKTGYYSETGYESEELISDMVDIVRHRVAN